MIVTILDFVYVPLNLATSVFGMNLQQLNGNGRSLRDFVLTAILTLLVTGGAWLVSGAASSYKNWQKGRWKREKPLNRLQKPEYSIAERCAMVVWLLRQGHGSWMRRSGAWWRILQNSGVPIVKSRDGAIMAAGHYVSEYSREHIPNKDLFQLRDLVDKTE